METMAETSLIPVPSKSAIYDEVAMQKSLLFSESLKDLKNLRKQLYSAAEYFEFSYTNDDQKHVVVTTLKDYSMKALVNTVDHLGSMNYRVIGLLDENVEDVSRTELRVSCIQQRLQVCGEYFDREGVSEQSVVINTPKYYSRYILPSGETMCGGVRTKSKFQGCIIEDKDDWRQLKNSIRSAMQEPQLPIQDVGKKIHQSSPPPPKLAQKEGSLSFPSTKLNKDSGRKTDVSPGRFPILRSISIKPSSTVRTSRPSTPTNSWPTTPNSSLDHQFTIPEPRKSSSMGSPKNSDNVPGKSKRLLKGLISRRKSRKDDMLDTYIDEY